MYVFPIYVSQLLMTFHGRESVSVMSDTIGIKGDCERCQTKRCGPAGSNNESVAEDEVMRILLLVRNFLPAHQQILKKEWDVPATAGRSWDLQGKIVGTVGGGRIGYETLRRLEVCFASLLGQ